MQFDDISHVTCPTDKCAEVHVIYRTGINVYLNINGLNIKASKRQLLKNQNPYTVKQNSTCDSFQGLVPTKSVAYLTLCMISCYPAITSLYSTSYQTL